MKAAQTPVQTPPGFNISLLSLTNISFLKLWLLFRKCSFLSLKSVLSRYITLMTELQVLNDCLHFLRHFCTLAFLLCFHVQHWFIYIFIVCVFYTSSYQSWLRKQIFNTTIKFTSYRDFIDLFTCLKIRPSSFNLCWTSEELWNI